ncbi:MAG TPA: hypothetical protein VF470_05225, partial [Sphingomicrobium sp.]
FDLAHPEKAKEAAPDLAARLQKRVSELTATGVPLKKASEQARLEFGQSPPAEPQGSFSFPVVGGPGGPVVAKANNKTGDIDLTDIGGKPDASQTKLTEVQEKSHLFYKLMNDAQPQIDAAMQSGKVRKGAVTAYINAPDLLHAGINSQLSREEQSLIRAFRDFAAGVLRKESGAAVTPGEMREVWGRYGPGFGDDPTLDAEKSNARKSYMETMKQQAGPALDFYAKHATGGGSASPLRAKYDAAAKHLQSQDKTAEQIRAVIGDPPRDEPEMSGGRSLPRPDDDTDDDAIERAIYEL